MKPYHKLGDLTPEFIEWLDRDYGSAGDGSALSKKTALHMYDVWSHLHKEIRELNIKLALANSPQADDVRKDAWISVEDRFPPMGEVVIVYGALIGQALDEWTTYHECPVSFSTITVETGEGWSEHEFEEVTHWMPLPAPPLDKARE